LGKGELEVLPGKYHVKGQEFLPFKSKTGPHIVRFQIVWAEKGKQETEPGKIHTEFFFSKGRDTSDNGWSDRLAKLALASGILSEEEYKRCKEEGVAPEFDFAVDFPGKHMLIELVKVTDNSGNDRIRIGGRGFAMFHVNSPESKGFPVLDGLLKQDGIERQVESKAQKDLSSLI
jgi:hypothetical protein